MFRTDNLPRAVQRCDNRWKEDWYDWLPETLETAFNRIDGGIVLIDMDRVLAARNLRRYGFFWDDPDIFEATINAFNWVNIDHRLSVHPSPAQTVYGVRLARTLVEEPEPFSENVCNYIASIWIERGLMYVPASFHLAGVQPVLDHYYHDNDRRHTIGARWADLQETDEPPAFDEENLVDMQCAQLLAIQQYAKEGPQRRDRETIDIDAKLILG